MIQSQFGRLEMHFHIFSALALLLIYRNWVNVVVPAGVIAVYHLAFTWLQLEGGFQMCFRILRTMVLHQNDGQVCVCRYVARLDLQRLSVSVGGVIEPPS